MNGKTSRLESALTAGVLALILLLAHGCGRPAEPTAEVAWPQFRGPGGLGVADGAALPTSWGEDTPNIRWRTTIPGRGNSSPVAAAGRAFLTTANSLPGKEKPRMAERMVVAVDLASGEISWQTVVATTRRTRRHQHNTNAAPTPVTDGERLYVYFGSVLACLDHDGNVLWNGEVDPYYPAFVRYGTASSLVLVNGAVIVVQDKEWGEGTEDQGWMGAFDAETGEELWRNHWTETCCAYSSPLIWRRGEDTELIFAHSGNVAAYDPDTGEHLWEHPYPMLQSVASPVAAGDLLCVLGGAHNNKGNLCVRVTGRGEELRIEQLWFDPRLAPESASAVLYGGRLYAVTDRGVMVSYDPQSGTTHWSGRLKEGLGYRSSLIAGDGKIYAVSADGTTSVVDAKADKLAVLAYNKLGEGGNNATPAVADGCLLIRSHNELFCIEKEGVAS